MTGLRRDEVALLAGVSADYYTRLEQGRERHPSDQVLDAISRALQLDRHASTHLFRIIQSSPRSATVLSSTEVHPELANLMRHFIDAPACILGPALDVLEANEHARALYSGFARLDNIVRMVFLDPVAPKFYLEWDRTAAAVVNHLRDASSAFQNDPRVVAVVGELSVRSPAFAAQWARHEVRPRINESKRLYHPQVGELHLHYEGFTVSNAPGQQLFIYTAEQASRSADGLCLLAQFGHDNSDNKLPSVVRTNSESENVK